MRYLGKLRLVKTSVAETLTLNHIRNVIFKKPLFIVKTVNFQSANGKVFGNSWRMRGKCFCQFPTSFSHTATLRTWPTKTRRKVRE